MWTSESLNWGDAGFSGTKERCEAAAQRNSSAISEKRNFSGTDSEMRENICWTIAGLSSANEVFGCK